LWGAINELVYSSSHDPDLPIYAAKWDGTLTIIIIHLSLEGKTKAVRIEGQAEFQAEAWLFDLDHEAENPGGDGVVQLYYRPTTIHNTICRAIKVINHRKRG
jgi:hypothetical protein